MAVPGRVLLIALVLILATDGSHGYTLETTAAYTSQWHDIRLVNGYSRASGRVEVYYNGQWGTLCGVIYNYNATLVICRMLGYHTRNIYGFSNARFGTGPGPIIIDRLRCDGDEAYIGECHGSITPVQSYCLHSEVFGVDCDYGSHGYTSTLETTAAYTSQWQDIRLVNGYSQASGRVEVYHNGQWGTICDDFHDYNSSLVICRMLGYHTRNVHAYSAARFGTGPGPILIDGLHCYGDEADISECYIRPAHGYCRHSEDIGVDCDYGSHGYTLETTAAYTSQWQDIRLVNGYSPASGRVEVYHNGQWGTICDMNYISALVICRMLGYHTRNVRAYGNARFGYGPGPILIDALRCSGNEAKISECTIPPAHGYCGHSEDIGVDCDYGSHGYTLETTAAYTSQWQDIRLVNGYSRASGRVEVYHNGQWGTICDDNHNYDSALVICRVLGYHTRNVHAYGNARFGIGPGPILIDALQCSGNEAKISECYIRPAYGNCQHYEDIGVDCDFHGYETTEEPTTAQWRVTLSTIDVRLVNGRSPDSGRVEVFYQGNWGTICDPSHFHTNAQVICRMLGYSTQNVHAYGYDVYGGGSGLTIISGLHCRGDEATLADCPSNPWMTRSCNHYYDASIDCRYGVTTQSPVTTSYPWWYYTTTPSHPNKECAVTTPADIVFILDASGSVGDSNFRNMLAFITRLVDSFPVNRNEVHIGLVTYDDSTNNQFYLNTHYDKQSIKTAVLRTRYTGGGTETSGALRYVRQNTFSTHYGARTNAAKVAIIITDGQSNDAVHTTNEAALLRNDGVTIFSIGVGNARTSELNAMASDPDSTHVFQVTNFAALETIRHTLTTKTCQATGLSIENAITVGCNEYGWNVTIDMNKLRQIYPDARPSDIYMGENSCTGVYNGATVTFSQGIRECLTSEQISGDRLMYMNELVYAEHDPLFSYIIRHYNWTVSVECDVTRNNTSTGNIHHDSHEHSNHQVTGLSHYAVNMSFYQDPNFIHPIPGNPLHVKVGTEVYTKVYTTATDWTMKMRVHTCYTKPTPSSPDHMKYYLIKNGCEVDGNTHIISQSSHETRFVFQDFEYTTNPAGIYVYCDSMFCASTDYSRQCTQTCNPITKRSVDSHSDGETGDTQMVGEGEYVEADANIENGATDNGENEVDVPQRFSVTVWRQIIHTK